MNTALLAFGFIFGANVAATAVLMVHDTNNIRTLKKLHARLKALESHTANLVNAGRQ